MGERARRLNVSLATGGRLDTTLFFRAIYGFMVRSAGRFEELLKSSWSSRVAFSRVGSSRVESSQEVFKSQGSGWVGLGKLDPTPTRPEKIESTGEKHWHSKCAAADGAQTIRLLTCWDFFFPFSLAQTPHLISKSARVINTSTPWISPHYRFRAVHAAAVFPPSPPPTPRPFPPPALSSRPNTTRVANPHIYAT